MKLHGSAIDSGCATSFLEPRDELQFSWTQAAGPAFAVNTDTSNTPVLYVGPGTLKANQNYTLNRREPNTRPTPGMLSHPINQSTNQSLLIGSDDR